MLFIQRDGIEKVKLAYWSRACREIKIGYGAEVGQDLEVG